MHFGSKNGIVQYKHIPGVMNPANLMTKKLGKLQLRREAEMIGLEFGAVQTETEKTAEGNEDAGETARDTQSRNSNREKSDDEQSENSEQPDDEQSEKAEDVAANGCESLDQPQQTEASAGSAMAALRRRFCR